MRVVKFSLLVIERERESGLVQNRTGISSSGDLRTIHCTTRPGIFKKPELKTSNQKTKNYFIRAANLRQNCEFSSALTIKAILMKKSPQRSFFPKNGSQCLTRQRNLLGSVPHRQRSLVITGAIAIIYRSGNNIICEGLHTRYNVFAAHTLHERTGNAHRQAFAG